MHTAQIVEMCIRDRDMHVYGVAARSDARMTLNEFISSVGSPLSKENFTEDMYLSLIHIFGEKKKKLQERALLEQLSELAPDYAQAEQLLVRLKAEQKRNSMTDRDGGESHDGVGQQDHR